MFLFSLDGNLEILKENEMISYKMSSGVEIDEIRRTNLQGNVDFALKDNEAIYFSCQGIFSIFKYIGKKIESVNYDYPIKYFSVVNGAMLVVLEFGLKFMIVLKMNDFQMELEFGDIPYFYELGSKTINIYFQTKMMKIDLNKDLIEVKQVTNPIETPKSIKYFKGKWYALSGSSVFISKTGLEWSTFKQNCVSTDFDHSLLFVTKAEKCIFEYGNEKVVVDELISCVCYLGNITYIANSFGISSLLDSQLVCVVHFNTNTQQQQQKIKHLKVCLMGKIGILGNFDQNKIVRSIIGDYIPVITDPAKNSSALMKKMRNLKDFLKTESRFETYESIKCLYEINKDELECALVNRKATFQGYQHKMEEFDKSKTRMRNRLEKLDFIDKPSYSSLKMTTITNFERDSLINNDYTQDLLLSQKNLVQSAMKTLEDEGIKQEKILKCSFEKVDNEVVSLEFNSEKLILQMRDFISQSRNISDFPANKLSLFLSKGRPKFRKGGIQNRNDNEKSYYDFLEDTISRFKFLCARGCNLLEISALDFRFTNEKFEISYFPSELIILIQKQTRHLEEQYSCDKEEILGIEHSVNIVDWEHKILTILRDSLKSDLMECASLKPKKEMIFGLESPFKIQKEFKNNEFEEPKEKLLQHWQKKNEVTKALIIQLRLKRDEYVRRSHEIIVVPKPGVDLDAFKSMRKLSKLKSFHEKLTQLQTVQLEALFSVIEKSRPNL